MIQFFSELLEKASILGQNFSNENIYSVLLLIWKEEGKDESSIYKIDICIGWRYLFDSAKDEYLF